MFFYEFYLNIKYFILCKSLRLKYIKWQRDFALCRNNDLPNDRGAGRTTAIVLRALIFGENAKDVFKTFLLDPSFIKTKRFEDFITNKYFSLLNSSFIFNNKRKRLDKNNIRKNLYKIFDCFLSSHLEGFKL